MNLREYLFRHNLNVTEFSRQIDFSRTHLSKVIHGERKPSLKLARAIERATNGEVSIKEQREDKIN